ncbi:MAG: hypothetical protein OXE46_10910 [Chloroflexi bacterium]|nr:hypothetical protein [Chloroflexota bacterium]
MQTDGELSCGAVVRMTTPYREAARGPYIIVYIYRNGWLGLVSRRDGRRYNVPAFICRVIASSKAEA